MSSNIKITQNFRILLLFGCLIVSFFFTWPYLQISLLPQVKGSKLLVKYTFGGGTPESNEQLVTSILENELSVIKGVVDQHSITDYNGGEIFLSFETEDEIDQKRLEINGILRRIYPTLPDKCSYPEVSISNGSLNNLFSPFLVYTINSNDSVSRIRNIAEKYFRSRLSEVEHIKQITFSGSQSSQLVVEFDRRKCDQLGVSLEDLSKTIRHRLSSVFVGSIITNENQNLFLKTNYLSSEISKISDFIFRSNNRIFKLRDVSKVFLSDQINNNYFRINGNNLVTVSIMASDRANTLQLGKKIKESISLDKLILPTGYKLLLSYDETEYLEKEIDKNIHRALLAVVLLLIFIIVLYRSWRNGIIFTFCLLASLSITSFLCIVFQVQIHFYSIAGIAISLGIVTDVFIVMLDYYFRFGDKRIFNALLAGILTTMLTLSVVFFMPTEKSSNLVDFALIIILFLLSGSVVAYWFLPSLVDSISHPNRHIKKTIEFSYFPLLVYTRKSYLLLLKYTFRFKKLYIFLLIISFGIPFYLLPKKIINNDFYNATLGCSIFQEDIKPILDVYGGGVTRLFIKKVVERSGYRTVDRTKLFVKARLGLGTTSEQLNNIILPIESYLNQVKGIDTYVTNIYSAQNASIEITFEKKFENSDLPNKLKNILIQQTLNWGGVMWNIYGVGNSFGNITETNMPGFKVELQGYSYDSLYKISQRLISVLKINPRVQNINSNVKLDDFQDTGEEWNFVVKRELFSLFGISESSLFNTITSWSKENYLSFRLGYMNKLLPVNFREKKYNEFSMYDFKHVYNKIDSGRFIRMNDLGNLRLDSTLSSVIKRNRQYIRIIGFEYLGSEEIGGLYLNVVISKQVKLLPMGIKCFRKYDILKAEQSVIELKYLIVVLALILFVTSVLFENIWQSLVIIALILVSYIGIFLIFVITKSDFDQGGYASFVMVSALVANAAILIVNDFNRYRKNYISPFNAIKDTIKNRARSIILTTIGASCSLVPFLIEGQNEVFWFSFALGTLGGLISSLVSLFWLLPVLLLGNKKGYIELF